MKTVKEKGTWIRVAAATAASTGEQVAAAY